MIRRTKEGTFKGDFTPVIEAVHEALKDGKPRTRKKLAARGTGGGAGGGERGGREGLRGGVQGITQYGGGVGAQLAKRMGKEAYMGWPSYNVALRERRTAFSIDGDVTALTDLAITDEDGDVVGYIYALQERVV